MTIRNKHAGPRKQIGAATLDQIIYTVLGLIALGIFAAIAAKGFSSSDVRTDISNTTQILQNVRGTLRDPSGYGAAGTSLVAQCIQQDCVPKNMTVSGTTLYNQWNGTITIVSTGLGFTYTSPQIPQAACVQEATKISASGTYTLSINGTAQAAGTVANGAAQTACSTSSNTIAITSAS